MKRKIIFAISSILSFAAGGFCFAILFVSCSGHSPFLEIGFAIMPVSTLGSGFFIYLGTIFWHLREVATSIDGTGKKRFSHFASLSLWFSLFGLFIPFLGIAAIIVGKLSLNKIWEDQNISGSALAYIGIILGALSVFYYSLLILSLLFIA